MKLTLFTAIVFVLLAVGTSQAQNYELVIDGIATPIELGSAQTVALPNGQKLSVLLKQNEILKYKSEMFEFEHANSHKPSKSKVAEGIDQTALMTPLGTGLVIQQFSNINPIHLIDLMGHQITKNEVGYGYDLKEEPIQRKIGEHVLKGKRWVTTYRQSRWTTEVLAAAGKDQGLLITTITGKGLSEQESVVIDHFWKTLKISFSSE